MRILGISEGFHDAGATLIQNGNILKATHAERFSRKKNDRWLHPKQKIEADIVAFYEKPWLKRTRQLYAGQGWKSNRSQYDVSYYHHQTHAAAGFYTSKFDSCNILVVDAIGEWDTVSIWQAWMDGDKPHMKKIFSEKYPFSIGLFYSAVTQKIGLKPNEDEFITMGMAAYGEPLYSNKLKDILEYDNCHKGLPNAHWASIAKNEDIAASAQKVIEDKILYYVEKFCLHQNLNV